MKKWVKPTSFVPKKMVMACGNQQQPQYQHFMSRYFPRKPRHVDALTLAVCLVEQDGLVAEWNKFQPTCAIEPGSGNVRRETTVVSKIALRLHRSCSKNFLFVGNLLKM